MVTPWITFLFSFFFFCLSVFSEPRPQHMEVPRLGVQSELQLLAYATTTAMADPSLICDLHHSSQQRWILHPLSKARDQTCNLMVPSRIRFCCTTMGIPRLSIFKTLILLVSVFLIFTSLIIIDIEYLFICVGHIWYPLLFIYPFFHCNAFFMLIYQHSLHIWNMRYMYCKHLLQAFNLPFTLFL